MSAAAFNEWRRVNDLPQLLQFFQTCLPHFDEWQSTYALTDTDFIQLPHTSHFFLDRGIRYLIDATGPSGDGEDERSTFIADLPSDEWVLQFRKRWSDRVRFEIHSSKAFRPYFDWLKSTKGINLFRIPHDANNSLTNDIQYMAWEGGDLSVSRALLFHSHKVLKLGGLTLSPQQLDGRNLDFVDLDGLEVLGDGWTRTTFVGYSSCRQIRITNSEKAFLTFRRCTLAEFRVDNSRLQDLHFVDCVVAMPTFIGSRLFRMSFTNSNLGGATFDDCELRELLIQKLPLSMSYSDRSDMFKSIRFAFQQRGNRKEASQYYYQERMSDFLSHFSPFFPQAPGLPRRAYVGTYRDLHERWRLKQYSGQVIRKLLRGNISYYLRLFLLPPFAWRFLRSKLTMLADTLDWGLWGFGERPARVFPWMLAVLSGFAAKYYFSANQKLHRHAMESLYCSAFNLSTMGCEFKTSFDSIEGLLGAGLLGIMLAGFANRTRY